AILPAANRTGSRGSSPRPGPMRPAGEGSVFRAERDRLDTPRGDHRGLPATGGADAVRPGAAERTIPRFRDPRRSVDRFDSHPGARIRMRARTVRVRNAVWRAAGPAGENPRCRRPASLVRALRRALVALH